MLYLERRVKSLDLEAAVHKTNILVKNTNDTLRWYLG